MTLLTKKLKPKT